VPRVVRRTTNQKLFREVNERIAELSATLDTPKEPQSFFCECSRLGCTEMVDVPLRIYAIVRDDEDLYVVLPGHEDLKNEEPVAEHEGFVLVRTLPRDPSRAATAELQLTPGGQPSVPQVHGSSQPA
jgi:hypothetical protein